MEMNFTDEDRALQQARVESLQHRFDRKLPFKIMIVVGAIMIIAARASRGAFDILAVFWIVMIVAKVWFVDIAEWREIKVEKEKLEQMGGTL